MELSESGNGPFLTHRRPPFYYVLIQWGNRRHLPHVSLLWFRSKVYPKVSCVWKEIGSWGHYTHQQIYPTLGSVAECAGSYWDVAWKGVSSHLQLLPPFCFLTVIDCHIFSSAMPLCQTVPSLEPDNMDETTKQNKCFLPLFLEVIGIKYFVPALLMESVHPNTDPFRLKLHHKVFGDTNTDSVNSRLGWRGKGGKIQPERCWFELWPGDELIPIGPWGPYD